MRLHHYELAGARITEAIEKLDLEIVMPLIDGDDEPPAITIKIVARVTSFVLREIMTLYDDVLREIMTLYDDVLRAHLQLDIHLVSELDIHLVDAGGAQSTSIGG